MCYIFLVFLVLRPKGHMGWLKEIVLLEVCVLGGGALFLAPQYLQVNCPMLNVYFVCWMNFYELCGIDKSIFDN